MGSKEFISLDAPCDVDTKDEESGPKIEASCLNGVEFAVCEHHLQEGCDTKECNETFYENVDVKEDQQVQDMDLEDDDVVIVKHHQLDACVANMQGVNGVASEQDKGNDSADTIVHESNNILFDESPTRGVKRARTISSDRQPSVRLSYSGLTRKSKRKLMELMQQWSEWQARNESTSKESTEEFLESGEETYYPALHIGSEKCCTLSFWVDNQAREHVANDDDSTPLYNREFALGSTPLGDSTNTERSGKDDSRCFNCGSYSHALKECPKPRDNVAISNARKQHNSKRTQSANRAQNRYYQKTPGKFDDLKAGVLGPETRECLGIGENDPPPWLHRMRELGYPPGYLEVVEDEDEPSGITIFADGDVKEEREEGELPEKDEQSPPRRRLTVEEGELPEKDEQSPPRRRMAVQIPGINAPIPENGDRWLWGSTPGHFSGPSSSSRSRHNSSDSWEQRDKGPPSAEHSYLSRYNSYDYGSPSPSFGRSQTDRGWRSSSGYDNSPTDSYRSPYPYSSNRQSPSRDMSSHHSRDRYDIRRHHRW